MLNGLSLFSGIGGIDVALSGYVKTKAYCEVDAYCQSVLFSRMSDGGLNRAPIWDDIRNFDGSTFSGYIDIIFGGFPCQDISVAGKGKGLEGERSGLFFEIMRLAKEIKPSFIFLENVPAVTSRGGLRVVREIAEMGYDCRWCVISAASVGALHRRERWFLLAHANNTRDGTPRYDTKRESSPIEQRNDSQSKSSGYRKDDSNSDSQSSDKTNIGSCSFGGFRQAWGNNSTECWPFESRDHWQETVSTMGKCTDGISFNVDRLRCLGNAVVPIQVKEAFEILMGIK